MDLALADPRMAEGLKARGLTPDQAFCLPLTAGAFGTADKQGRRLMKVPCYVTPSQSNFYAKPIEGLFAVVDLNAGAVLDVVDTGAVPGSRGRLGLYARTNSPPAPAWPSPGGPSRHPLPAGRRQLPHRRQPDRMGHLEPPLARRQAPGPRPLQIGVKRRRPHPLRPLPGAPLRGLRPLHGPDRGLVLAHLHGLGEYGFGIFLSPLTPGVDCPAYATFLPAVVHADDGSPAEIPNAVCVFERNVGDPAWRHFEVFAQTPEAPLPAEGRPATELVVRSASEVGNYDYLLDYVFQENGMIRVMVGATGLDAVKGVAAKSMRDPSAAEDTRFGTLIAPNLVAPNHDHFFNYRLDFDVDGQANMFTRTALVAEPPPRARSA